MASNATPIALGNYRAELGESPLWDAGANRLFWLDILQSRLLSTEPGSGTTKIVELGRQVSAIAFDPEGEFVAAAGRDIIRLASGDVLATLPTGPSGRFNDAKADRAGRFWSGTADADGQPRGALYRFEGRGQLKKMLDGIQMSNGIGWSPDGRTMYYVDTGSRRLEAFDFDPASGDLDRRRALVTFPAGQLPDGLTVDADGRIWLAVWGSASVLAVTPQGQIDRQIDLPTSRVSSCAFGGPDLRTLFITTAQEGATLEELAADPLAGALFAVELDVQGLPPDRVRF